MQLVICRSRDHDITLLQNIYNQAHFCDGYLIKLSTKIPSTDILPAGLSNGYVLHLLPLSFVTKANCTDDYFAITPAHRAVWWLVEADTDILKSRAYAASS